MNKEYAKMNVGNGWHGLVDEAFDHAEHESFDIVEVKEKFGMLRVYTSLITDEVYKKIADLEIKSMTICECCGGPGSPHSRGGWVKTTCKSCREINRVLAEA